jgi:hypothetical protein
MHEQLHKNGYVVVDDFIAPERAKELWDHFAKVYETYPESFVTSDSLVKKSPSIYDMWEFVELMLEKLPYMNEQLEEPLFPTYSYARMYKNGEDLEPHMDRPECEVSISLHLGSDGVEWPLKFIDFNENVVSVNLKPGQAVVYLGCQVTHWREVYEGSDYRQVFLHYVKARGVNKSYYFDKRN